MAILFSIVATDTVNFNYLLRSTSIASSSEALQFPLGRTQVAWGWVTTVPLPGGTIYHLRLLSACRWPSSAPSKAARFHTLPHSEQVLDADFVNERKKRNE